MNEQMTHQLWVSVVIVCLFDWGTYLDLKIVLHCLPSA